MSNSQLNISFYTSFRRPYVAFWLRVVGNISHASVVDLDELADSVSGEVCLLIDANVEPGQIVPQRFTLETGQVALQLYSSAAVVLTLSGTEQPWRWVTVPELRRIARQHGCDVALLDTAPIDSRAYPEVDVRDAPDAEVVSELQPPELVYVPSRPVRTGDRRVFLELQPDDRGRRTLLVYTSADELVAGCGQYQPWVAVFAERLDKIAAEAGAEIVLFNPILSEDARHSAPVQDWTRKAKREDEYEWLQS